jgi:hypothetical protein
MSKIYGDDPVSNYARQVSRRSFRPKARIDSVSAEKAMRRLLSVADELNETVNTALIAQLAISHPDENFAESVIFLQQVAKTILSRRADVEELTKTVRRLPDLERKRGQKGDAALKALVFKLAEAIELREGKPIRRYTDRESGCDNFYGSDSEIVEAIRQGFFRLKNTQALPELPDIESIQYYLRGWVERQGVNSKK